MTLIRKTKTSRRSRVVIDRWSMALGWGVVRGERVHQVCLVRPMRGVRDGVLGAQ